MKTHSRKLRSKVVSCEQGKFATLGEKSKRKLQIIANTMRVVLKNHPLDTILLASAIWLPSTKYTR
jgi:hypothetical protein